MQGAKKHFIGMRNIKTAVAVLACMILFEAFTALNSVIPVTESHLNLLAHSFLTRQNPIFACVASVIVMQSSLEKSRAFAVSRLTGTTVGVTGGLIFLWLNSNILSNKLTYLFVFAGIVLIIGFCNAINQPSASSISIITFLVVMISLEQTEPFYYAVNRIIDTLIGITVSLVINLTVLRPKENPPNQG